MGGLCHFRNLRGGVYYCQKSQGGQCNLPFQIYFTINNSKYLLMCSLASDEYRLIESISKQLMPLHIRCVRLLSFVYQMDIMLVCQNKYYLNLSFLSFLGVTYTLYPCNLTKIPLCTLYLELYNQPLNLTLYHLLRIV